MDKPKCWIKNVIKKKMSFENESWSWVQILNDIFNPTYLGLSIFDPNLSWNNPASFRVYWHQIKNIHDYSRVILDQYLHSVTH